RRGTRATLIGALVSTCGTRRKVRCDVPSLRTRPRIWSSSASESVPGTLSSTRRNRSTLTAARPQKRQAVVSASEPVNSCDANEVDIAVAHDIAKAHRHTVRQDEIVQAEAQFGAARAGKPSVVDAHREVTVSPRTISMTKRAIEGDLLRANLHETRDPARRL